MVGLRWGQIFPSGERCKYEICESNRMDGLMQYRSGGFISYEEIDALFGTKDVNVLKDGLGRKLEIEGEALEVLTAQILSEGVDKREGKPVDVEFK